MEIQMRRDKMSVLHCATQRARMRCEWDTKKEGEKVDATQPSKWPSLPKRTCSEDVDPVRSDCHWRGYLQQPVRGRSL